MNTDKVPAGLERVLAELEAWRGGRRKGARIPEEVWRLAARAVSAYGLNVVSQALRLNYYHLKRRAERMATARPAGGAPMFVELCAGQSGGEAAPDAGVACVVELAKGNGTRMRILVREIAAVDWGKLKEAFLGA